CGRRVGGRFAGGSARGGRGGRRRGVRARRGRRWGGRVVGALGRHVGRRWERLLGHAHEVSLHHRGPGGRGVAGPEVAGRTVVRRKPVVERVVAVPPDVHHRRRQLRGEPGEPGRRDVAAVVGRG